MFVIIANYGGVFLEWLLFSSTALMLLFAAFVFKRGLKQGRIALRKKAFTLVYLTAAKFFLIDAGFIADKLFCDAGGDICNDSKIHMFKVASLIMLIPACALIYKFYRKFIYREYLARRSVRGMRIRLWANISMLLVLGLTFWLVTPWATYLIYGSVNSVFLHSSWKIVISLAYLLILVTFWRYEDCSLSPESAEDKDFNRKAWVPRDTLWTALFMLMINHCLLIVSLGLLADFQ